MSAAVMSRTPQANPAHNTGSRAFGFFCTETSVAAFTTSIRKLTLPTSIPWIALLVVDVAGRGHDKKAVPPKAEELLCRLSFRPAQPDIEPHHGPVNIDAIV